MSITDFDLLDTQKQQNLTSLFVTAIEGGVNYWARVIEYRWDAPYAERYAVLVDREDEDGTEYRLTPDMMGTGLGRVAKAWPKHTNECGLGWVKAARSVTTADIGGDFDATDADIVCQFALFKELVYG
jgi:hypothetical protein